MMMIIMMIMVIFPRTMIITMILNMMLMKMEKVYISGRTRDKDDLVSPPRFQRK